MNETNELPKVKTMTTHNYNFFRIFDPKVWHPDFSSGPFLPITSSGEGNLPYKIVDPRGSTLGDYSQNIMLI